MVVRSPYSCSKLRTEENDWQDLMAEANKKIKTNKKPYENADKYVRLL